MGRFLAIIMVMGAVLVNNAGAVEIDLGLSPVERSPVEAMIPEPTELTTLGKCCMADNEEPDPEIRLCGFECHYVVPGVDIRFHKVAADVAQGQTVAAPGDPLDVPFRPPIA